MGVIEELKNVETEAVAQIEKAESLHELEKIRIVYLGRKGTITKILRGIVALSQDEKKEIGAKANELKDKISLKIAQKSESIKESETLKFKKRLFDNTLPGKKLPFGKPHPIAKTIHEISEIFVGLGYSVVEGPEAELDYFNFTALNQPSFHPARSSHDTFYLTEENIFDYDLSEEELREKTNKISLLRTHTSPVQIRVMLEKKPPVFIIAPGKCYRRDAPDASHSPVFHQIEGLAVDENITFADLKGTLELFAHEYFGPKTKVNFRASYFPFTEPSAEMDVSCVLCEGSGCQLCKGSGWLEVLGAGMVNPAVFEEVGYDSERYTGFAFGMGPERLTMLKYGIPDIRLFYENDLRFLRQF